MTLPLTRSQAAEPQAGTDRITGMRIGSRLDVRFGPDFVRFTPSSGPGRHPRGTSQVGRVGMWRGGGRIGLSVSAPFVWRCLNSRAMTPFPHPAHRTGRALLTHPALGQDITPLHTEGHEQPSDQPPGPWYPSVLRSTRLLANRQCHHLGRQWLPRPTPRFSLRFGMRSLPQLSHINGVQ